MIRAYGIWMNKRAKRRGGGKRERACGVIGDRRWGVTGRQIARGREWPWFQNGFLLDVNTYVSMRAIPHINTRVNPHSHKMSLIVSGLPCS